MKRTYAVLAYLIAAGVVLQAATIALGFFDIIGEVEGGGTITAEDDWEGNLGIVAHGLNGIVIIPALALALLIVSFFARAPRSARWAGAVFALVALQVALAGVAFAVPAVGALHGLNALALFAVSAVAGWRVGGRQRARRDDRPEETVPHPQPAARTTMHTGSSPTWLQ